MTRVVRPRRQTLNPDQIPLIVPESNWKVPTELPSLRGVEEFALDTETKDEGLAGGRGPGWAYGAGYVAGVGISWREGDELQKIYVPLKHPDTECFPKENVARWLRDITKKRRVVFFNAGYDIGWLKQDLDVPCPPIVDDASCAAFLIDENRDDLGLDGVCKWRGVEGKDKQALQEAAVIYGIKPKEAVANLWRLPARYAAPYGEQDPASTLLVMEDMRSELARQGLLRAYSTEMRLIPLIHEMRRRGIRVNIDKAERLRDGLMERRDKVFEQLNSRLRTRVGMEEIRSNSWLVRIFSQENAPYNVKNEKASFESDWMRASEHWLPRLVAEAKQCHEAADKFVQGYLLDFAHMGRIHASINQYKYEEGGTRSHRLSIADPPLQQAPSRPDRLEHWTLTGEIAKEYRGCFEPEDGELWFSPDYSQQEYRHIVADAEMLGLSKADVAAQKYRDDPSTDFHNLVVDLTGLTRREAKDCNFAKAFGAGIPKFAAMTDKTIDEAISIMGTYDREMPFVKEMAKLCDKRAQHRGYIKMWDGARSHFDKWEAAWLEKSERQRGWAEGYPMGECSREEAEFRCKMNGHPWNGKRLKRAFTHKAMNRRIQGGAARQTKEAMATCWEEGLVPLLQMHDELCFSLSDPRKGERVEEIMKTCYTCSVPFLVDGEWGLNWGDAKHTYAVAAAKLREVS